MTMVNLKTIGVLVATLVLVLTLGVAFAGSKAGDKDKPDIVDTAVAAGNFTTLVKAVEVAGLVEALKGEGPFTVFAPNDEAFAKIPEETLNALLEDVEKLKAILLYHVVSGKVLAKDVKDGLSVDTLLGKPVNFSVKDDVVKINDATIIATDILAKNGVIHVIDTVILPPED